MRSWSIFAGVYVNGLILFHVIMVSLSFDFLYFHIPRRSMYTRDAFDNPDSRFTNSRN